MSLSVPIDTRDISITPVFKHVTVEDVPASEREKQIVMKTLEVVEVRFAGSKLYSPVFPVDAMWKREGHNVITYAERWPEQYRAFIEGNDQKAQGTPLEMLQPYGISPNQLSLCRVLKIYSIEALDSLEGPNLKSLGMHGNDLKRMARDYLSDRAKGSDSSSEIARLRAEIEALKAATVVPMVEATADEIEDAIQAADDEFSAMDNDMLKEFIAGRTGQGRPRGNISRDSLLSMARDVA